MRIAFIGKFNKMHDEEYIAQGFEHIGHEVIRISDLSTGFEIKDALERYKPDILLYCKWIQPKEVDATINALKKVGMKTVCWLFDLYVGYTREYQLRNASFFKSDYVFTTDGGNQKTFDALKINHHCIRQGIRSEECFIQSGNPIGVAFVGSDNPANQERLKAIGQTMLYFPNFTWYGRADTDEKRGMELNELYGNTKIVIGDSVYSPYYWSNRVVETLGRGGFLIHQDVPGIKEEYPYLVTYEKGNLADLKNKITYYLNHEDERKEILLKNFEWVRDHYTIEKKCQELLDVLRTTHNH